MEVSVENKGDPLKYRDDISPLTKENVAEVELRATNLSAFIVWLSNQIRFISSWFRNNLSSIHE